ncbi:unnamed protein product [Clonostachys byssicola]|uniref:DNA-directed RNA polymerase I subunit rpa49 n=1 Tax=Clonostachys byssicola TaxID=160290 RepID=A0A9N9UR03_9HYPO|nr:unnamed protein product [Clonostachys byssicola]
MAKRKRDGEASTKVSKKVAIDAPAASAKVSSFLQSSECPPVIAKHPGINVPTNLSFQSYAPKDLVKSKGKSSKSQGQKELLLHSITHPNLDYTAKEDVPRGSKPFLNHYVGVYDPKTGKMQVIEAKRMEVRGIVRSKKTPESEGVDKDIKQTLMELKADLGQTFGTKKARKAIQDTVMNAISAPKKPGEDTPAKIDNAARAMLQSVGNITSTMATREELQAVVDEAKPVPIANVDADDIIDVYDPKTIIGGDILHLVPVREWQEKVQHKESIQVVSRFVAARVNHIAANEDATTRLRVLRYFYFVLLFYLHTKPGKQRGIRQLPPREKLREALAPAPEAVIENIRRKFSDAGQMRKYHIDLLMTHCCAFACIVDNFEVDTQNLRDDLRVDQKTINGYFREIGARVKPVSNKAEGKTLQLARLTLPLDFPKQRHIAPKKR